MSAVGDVSKSNIGDSIGPQSYSVAHAALVSNVAPVVARKRFSVSERVHFARRTFFRFGFRARRTIFRFGMHPLRAKRPIFRFGRVPFARNFVPRQSALFKLQPLLSAPIFWFPKLQQFWFVAIFVFQIAVVFTAAISVRQIAANYFHVVVFRSAAVSLRANSHFSDCSHLFPRLFSFPQLQIFLAPQFPYFSCGICLERSAAAIAALQL